jgi:transcription antitermination factor NusG
MSSGSQLFEPTAETPFSTSEGPHWYAIQTRPRNEKMVARQLQYQGVMTFLPLDTQVHRWSDRRKLVQLPLFPGYAFVHVLLSPETRLRVLHTESVVSFVGIRGAGTPIPDEQIGDVQMLLANNVPFAPCPFIRLGQRVRIRGGSLDGMEGILVARNSDQSLVVSVELIQRSLAIRIDGYDLETI